MIPFVKAHACGNDFLIVNEDDVRGVDKALLTQRLCERNTGIGADGIEFFEWTGDFSGRLRLHNADGSIAEISGNGTRCVAAWMAEERNRFRRRSVLHRNRCRHAPLHNSRVSRLHFRRPHRPDHYRYGRARIREANRGTLRRHCH